MLYQHLLKQNGCHHLARRALNAKFSPLAAVVSLQGSFKVNSASLLPSPKTTDGQHRYYHAINGLTTFLTVFNFFLTFFLLLLFHC